MASSADATDQAAISKPLDESLWWDSFVLLFEELDNTPLSSDLPDHLAKKLKSNHSWFLDSVSLFKPPNQVSRNALQSPQVSIGSHHLVVKHDLKEAALRVSTCLCLDEVQSYILINRYFELHNSVADFEGQEFLHLILLQYYLERQCLLKCIRRIFVHALYMGNGSQNDVIMGESLQLVLDGLERKLLTILQDLLSSASSEKSEVDFTVLWVEETLIEDNLILDILFLTYYENFCSCSSGQWKNLCSLFKGILSGSFNIGKLAVSAEARNSFYHAKAQLLLILIETLDLENLLRMVHDETPFREGFSVFSLSDVQEIDAILSSFSSLGALEAGPLILAWAVFLCLLLSLPEKKDYNMLMEIDHIGYVRQAFEVAPFNYLLEILCSDTLKDSDGPVSGFLSVMRTFISAFIASYELAHQPEDDTLKLILHILCQIYRGEESLSMQFWDKDSFVDGPIRSLLYLLESEFPFRTVELVRLLSALCEGMWPAECVYNFLEKMSGITLMFEIPADSRVADTCDFLETDHPLHIPGVEGIIIPRGTRGYVLKVLDENVALIRWEYAQPGVLLLLLRLAQELHAHSYEEVFLTLDLLYRMVSFNTALCFSLMGLEMSLPGQAVEISGQIERNVRVDVVNIICTLVCNLVQDVSNAGVVSICINILVEMLKCAPSHVIEVASRTNVFGTQNNGSSSSGWLLSGGLAKMLLADCGQNEECFLLTTSVLDFTLQLVEKGAEDDIVSALLVFSLQYVLVNHVHWKYKVKYARWRMTLKVFEVMRKCIKSIQVSQKLGCMIRNIILCDSSIHNILCRVMCISTQTLERLCVSRHYGLKEIEGLQLAVCSALDIVFSMLADLSKETISNAPVFVQTMLSSATKPIPVVTAAISLISFFHNSVMQVAAARVLSILCCIASRVQPYSFENSSFAAGSLQIRELSNSICRILDEELNQDEDLVVAVVNLLISAACYQPAFLVSILLLEKEVDIPSDTAGNTKEQLVLTPIVEPLSSKKASPIDSILNYVKRSENLIESAPRLLLSILNFLKALWEGGVQYVQILEKIRSSELFWKYLSSPILAAEATNGFSIKRLKNDEILYTAYRYQCQAAVLNIMAHDMFLQKKLLQDALLEKKTSVNLKGRIENRSSSEISKLANVLYPEDIISTWFESPIMGNLIKLYSSSGYDKDIVLRAKMAVCLCIVHLIANMSIGNSGCLSLSLVEKIRTISNKLTELPAFSSLLAQYSLRGYSKGKELTSLVLSDLYYHLEGELEGREIPPGPFKELSFYLLDLEIFQCDERKSERGICPPDENGCMFDITRIKEDIGIELWDNSDWKASKAVAERMLMHMHDANLIVFHADSKHLALKSLIAIISVCEGNILEAKTTILGRGVSEPLTESSIGYICKCLQATEYSLVPALKPPEDLLDFLTTQAELLLDLSRILSRQHSQRTNRRQFLPVYILLIKTSGVGIRFLADVRASSTVLAKAVKLLLTLLLASVEFSNPKLYVEDKSDLDTDLFAEAALTSLGLLPILCKYVENTEYSNLSVAAIDVMLKGFLSPNTWMPIIQKHLRLQLVIKRIHQKDALASVPIILKFLLTLARNKGGAEMLHSANLFSSLKVLFNLLFDNIPFSNNVEGSAFCTIFNKDEKHVHIWGLGLAIITSMIYSLGDASSCSDIVDSAIRYFFSEKAYIMSCYLSAPNTPADDNSKKRARTQKTQTSLTALKETEHTLMLICALAKHHASWIKNMKEMDSELREMSIHLLAFISRGVQRIGDSPNRVTSLVCLPTLKEEVDNNERPSFVNSRHGWFTPAALGVLSKPKVSALSSTGSPLVTKDQGNKNDLVKQTCFSDTVAIQMYRIALLLLKFLCMQAKAAAKRAEEMEFIDLAHFPELPMPEILHGLEDQAIAIVTEVCESNRSKPIHPETQVVCLLLLQVLEKSLYLELCVSQSCGIRPVLGRIEDFSKEIKRLMRVIEQQTVFRASLKSLRQIVVLVYPGLLQTDNLI